MKSKPIKSTEPKPDTVISLQQENQSLSIQLNTAKKKILTLQNKVLKLELKMLEQEQKTLEVKIETEKLKKAIVDPAVLDILQKLTSKQLENPIHIEPPEK